MKLLTLILLIISFESYSQEKKYTQEEFDQSLKKALDEKVKKQVDEKIEKIMPTNMVKFSKELIERQDKISKKEEEIKLREEQFKINEIELTKKINKFQLTQDKMIGCLNENQKKSDARMSKLVDVIENMRPANAAEVLSTQEPDISVKIIQVLDTIKAAKIFNLMDKEVSARLQKQYLLMKK